MALNSLKIYTKTPETMTVPINFCLHIPSCWVKIGWHTKNQLKWVKVSVNNGQLQLRMPPVETAEQ